MSEDIRRFAVIGSPVAHSKSPLMHEAAFRELGLPHVYEKLETSASELPRRVDALRRGDLAGVNVTVPHKTSVLAFVDDVDASARVVGAANTLARTIDGRVRAHNTDAPALAAELVRLASDGVSFEGRSALVLGSGGAARAAIVALALDLRVGRIIVRGRSLAARSDAAAYERAVMGALGSAHSVHDEGGHLSRRARAVEIRAEPLEAPEVEDADLVAVVQATSCGMKGGGPGEVVAEAVRWDRVPEHTVALDVVYAPRNTAFLARARARGLPCDDGLGMLAKQGALAFELWLGIPAPLDVMRAALIDWSIGA